MLTAPEPSNIDTISPIGIAEVTDHLAAKIRADGNADLLGPWAISRLAAKLGVTLAISSSTDPVEVVRDLGEDWADLIIATNREDPDLAPGVLLAAHTVFERIKRGPAGQGG